MLFPSYLRGDERMGSGKIGLLILCMGYGIEVFAGPCSSKPLTPEMVDISGLPKPFVLQCFFNETFLETSLITPDYARRIIEAQGTNIGTLRGKDLSIEFSGDTMDVARYNKKHGNGKGQAIIALAREEYEEARLGK